MDLVLAQQGLTDPATGAPLSADDVFADWAAALYLHDSRLGDGRYAYRSVSPVPTPAVPETVATCPAPPADRTVSQYGIDYIRIACPGTFTLHFSGSQQVRLVPPDPTSGETYLWSNRGDDSDMTLTHAFDFSTVQGPLSFTYRTWFDIEEDYDYVYLEASTDGGGRWTILHTPAGTDSNPSGNSYGWGYTALSGGGAAPEWITETVDLSAYAGKQVLLRFEYVTDAAVNHAGLVLDDLSIPQAGYSEDFESGDGGWQIAGWVRVRNRLPQTFGVQIIEKGQGTRVTRLALDSAQQGEYTFTIGGQVTEALVIVSGTTRFTQEVAAYRYEITSP
ncbi:MAG: immune inhibitor A [Chloroflexi bacterium]|nr:immune inhibitor A [Chloroflexota bacterium]